MDIGLINELTALRNLIATLDARVTMLAVRLEVVEKLLKKGKRG